MIHSSIEIEAAPERVRDILLDFSSIPTWHTGYIKALESPSSPPFGPSDGISGTMGGVDFHATIIESTANTFSWTGPPFHGLFKGVHVFRFTPSTGTPGGTTFVQEESFEGLLAWMFVAWGPMGRVVKGYFEGFNRDLKKTAEGGGVGVQEG